MAGPPVGDVLQNVGQGQYVGVFLVHVEKIDGVGSFVAVEHALLGHDHPVAVGATVQHAGADAPAGCLAASDDGVYVVVVKVAH